MGRRYEAADAGVKGINASSPHHLRLSAYPASEFVSHPAVILSGMADSGLDIEQTFVRVSNMSSVFIRTAMAGPIRRETK